MDSTANPAASQTANALARLQKMLIGALFAGVLLVPKLLNLRRDERSWTVFRVLLGIAGAGFVILPLAFWNSAGSPRSRASRCFSPPHCCRPQSPSSRRTTKRANSARSLSSTAENCAHVQRRRSSGAFARRHRKYLGARFAAADALDHSCRRSLLGLLRRNRKRLGGSSSPPQHCRGICIIVASSQSISLKVTENTIRGVMRPGLPVNKSRAARAARA